MGKAAGWKVIVVCLSTLGGEGSGLEGDRGVRVALRTGVRLRAPHVDEQGQGAGLQAAVRRLRASEAAARRRHDERQLQPSSQAVNRRHNCCKNRFIWRCHILFAAHVIFISSELQSTFSRLAHLVDISRGDLTSQLKQIRDEMTKLDETGGKARKLR